MKHALRLGVASLLVTALARAQTGASGRVDALVDTQQQNGLLVVQGSGGNSWMNAEAYVWSSGSTAPGMQPVSADALTFTMMVHDSRNIAELRFGRFTYQSGAIRPVEIDGATVTARAPWGTKVEVVAGAPVIPGYGPHEFDWLVGGRLSQTVVSNVILGLSYVERWHDADVADQEVGTDLAVKPSSWLDMAGRVSYDIASPGISEALVSVAAHAGDFRFEAFASHRSPSRILLDTSLFSIFGDFTSENVGGDLYWKAAPRLQVWLIGAGQYVAGVYGGNAVARARLALDDKNDGAITGEVQREDVSTARWTGMRLTATKSIVRTLRASTELELVIPDDSSKGAAWPWGLVSVGWRPTKRWELAGGVQAASTPIHEYELNLLGRFSLFWEAK